MGFTKDPKGKPFLAGWSRRRAFSWGIVMTAVLYFFPLSVHGEPVQPPFRIGFSQSTFGDVNENDAIASIRIWAQMLVRDQGIRADPQPQIFENAHDISEALAHKTIDCVSMSSNEYLALQRYLAKDVIVGVVSGSIYEAYVLLVHDGSGIKSISDLRGRKIGFLESQRTALASIWLDTLLAGQGFGPFRDFFGEITHSTKLAKVVLPVFFRQMDACVATRSGFKTMVELNPQVGQQLKILAVSPSVVPLAFFFRSDYNTPLRDKIMGEITKWYMDPAGRQILTIFKIDKLEKQSTSCLKSVLELLAEHKRWYGGDKNVVPNNGSGEPAGKGR